MIIYHENRKENKAIRYIQEVIIIDRLTKNKVKEKLSRRTKEVLKAFNIYYISDRKDLSLLRIVSHSRRNSL